jgi:hypothetical protein
MSTNTYMQIVLVGSAGEELKKFTSTVSCDQLALTLFNWKGNCYADYLNILNDEEIEIVKATYGRESISVQEGTEKFDPKIVSISKVNAVLTKIRNKYLYPKLKENGSDFANFSRDLIAVSECIGALEVFKLDSDEIYLSIEDC